MKRRILLTSLLALFFGAALYLTSCEEPPPPVPDCEQYGYGWVTVQNFTGYQLKVDVTYSSTGVNYEKWLYNNGSYKYEMDKGKVYIWASFDGEDWVYDTYLLDACEDLTYKWYLNKKKSTNSLLLEISSNGEVIKTVTEFQTLKK